MIDYLMAALPVIGALIFSSVFSVAFILLITAGGNAHFEDNFDE